MRRQAVMIGDLVIGHIEAETTKDKQGRSTTMYYGSHQSHAVGWGENRAAIELSIRKAHDRLIADNTPRISRG